MILILVLLKALFSNLCKYVENMTSLPIDIQVLRFMMCRITLPESGDTW